MAELWEKQEYETAKQYEYFCYYRDMGPTRSIRKMQAELNKPYSFTRMCEKFSSQNKWQERCVAYQLYLDELKREQNEREILEMNQRHIQQSLMLQKMVIEKMKDAQPEELKIPDCARVLYTAVGIERTARGCDNGKISVEQSGEIEIKTNMQSTEDRIKLFDSIMGGVKEEK